VIRRCLTTAALGNEFINLQNLLPRRFKPFGTATYYLRSARLQSRLDRSLKRAALVGLDLNQKNRLIRRTRADLRGNPLHRVRLGRPNIQTVPAAAIAIYIDYTTAVALSDHIPCVDGFIDNAELERLWRRLQPLATDQMPLGVAPPRSTRFGSPLVLSRVHWVRPELVAEVKFLTWTEDNLLRQVVYEGLREDKPAEEVRREVPHSKPATLDTAAAKKLVAKRR
jgi:hypothetical protein